MESSTSIFATKADLFAAKESLAKDIATGRKETADAKADVIKWMFIFWVGQVAVTFGFILLFLNK
jgi:hypothetical protein